MDCANCGQRVDDAAELCPNCGFHVRSQHAEEIRALREEGRIKPEPCRESQRAPH